MKMSELAARVQKLEDIEAIKKLRAKYGYAVDEKRIDDVLALFSEDAKLDFGPFDRYETPEGLKAFYGEKVPAMLPFSMHLVHNAIIEVEGEKGTGVWYIKIPATFGPTGEAIWTAGKYEEEYIKVKGEWKFSFIKFIVNFLTPYDAGWVKKPFIEAP